MSKNFRVSYTEISRVPTLTQVGYLTGLLLIAPMGDLVKRRQLILLLIFLSATLTIGLAITPNLRVFEGLSFLVGVFTVVPQILVPMVADLAPPARRATAISIVTSGLLFGVLLARLLAGIIGNFASWRIVYYMAIGLQYAILIGAYFVVPDYPESQQGLTYVKVMTTMARYACTEPLVIQTSLVNIASSACFTSYWITLTFLLEQSPFNYSTLVVGLFSIAGLGAVAFGPVLGRVIDRLIPWYAALISTLLLLVFQAIQTGAGGISLAALIIACLGLDVFRQTQYVSLTAAVFSQIPEARSRVNAVLVVAFFLGQTMGTSVGTQVFVKYGWRAAAGVNMAWYGFQLVVQLARGPHVPRYGWVGWSGGWEARKSVVDGRQREAAERADPERAIDEREKEVDVKPAEESTMEKQAEVGEMAP
ncbi:hypothetical protein HWV62_40060 [Athelia sp. TMB]|nr:hypothetical protein HWV62_40060 [Athelia sp. TMB]